MPEVYQLQNQNNMQPATKTTVLLVSLIYNVKKKGAGLSLAKNHSTQPVVTRPTQDGVLRLTSCIKDFLLLVYLFCSMH